MNTNLSEETKKRLLDLAVTMREVLPSLGEVIGLDRYVTEETQQIQRAVAVLDRLPYQAAITATAELKRLAVDGLHAALRNKLDLLGDLVLQSRQLIMADDHAASVAEKLKSPERASAENDGTVVNEPCRVPIIYGGTGEDLAVNIDGPGVARVPADSEIPAGTIVTAAAGRDLQPIATSVSPSLVEQLLEQGNSFDLGGGWSVARRSSGKWHIYFQAKHWCCWRAELSNRKPPNDDELISSETVLKAVEVWQSYPEERQAVEQFAKSKRP